MSLSLCCSSSLLLLLANVSREMKSSNLPRGARLIGLGPVEEDWSWLSESFVSSNPKKIRYWHVIKTFQRVKPLIFLLKDIMHNLFHPCQHHWCPAEYCWRPPGSLCWNPPESLPSYLTSTPSWLVLSFSIFSVFAPRYLKTNTFMHFPL